MLLVRFPVNSRLLVVKCWRGHKLYMGFRLFWGGGGWYPNPSRIDCVSFCSAKCCMNELWVFCVRVGWTWALPCLQRLPLWVSSMWLSPNWRGQSVTAQGHWRDFGSLCSAILARPMGPLGSFCSLSVYVGLDPQKWLFCPLLVQSSVSQHLLSAQNFAKCPCCNISIHSYELGVIIPTFQTEKLSLRVVDFSLGYMWISDRAGAWAQICLYS